MILLGFGNRDVIYFSFSEKILAAPFVGDVVVTAEVAGNRFLIGSIGETFFYIRIHC